MRATELTIFPSIISWRKVAILAVEWFAVTGKRGQLVERRVALRRHEDRMKMKLRFCIVVQANW